MDRRFTAPFDELTTDPFHDYDFDYNSLSPLYSDSFDFPEDEIGKMQSVSQPQNYDSYVPFANNGQRRSQRVKNAPEPISGNLFGSDDSLTPLELSSEDWSINEPFFPSGQSKKRRNTYKEKDDDGFVVDDEEDTFSDDDFDSDDSFNVRRKRPRASKKPKKQRKQKIPKISMLPARTSTRTRKTVSYVEEPISEDEEYTANVDYSYNPQIVDPNEPNIDLVVDYRFKYAYEEDGSIDQTVPATIELMVKWKNKSHLHNTWHTETELQGVRGYKKVQNYLKVTLIEDPQMIEADEEREERAVENEIRRSILRECTLVERVLAVRESVDEFGNRNLEYLCKFCRLEYKDSTWEHQSTILPKHQAEIDAFYALETSPISPQTSKIYSLTNRPTWLSKEQPNFVRGGTLREYQLIGASWMTRLWTRNLNGILADEMGLGKTVQTITFLNILVHEFHVHGPFLIVVPLSVIHNWQAEFSKWAPDLNVVAYMGSRDSRYIIQEYEFYRQDNAKRKQIKFNVLLTSYELVLKDQHVLKSIKWQFLAVDEAHRLKNAASQLHEALKDFSTANRLLITGTPLQNSVKELNSLVQFLMPLEFADLEEFDIEGVEQEKILQLQGRLKPLMLRRLKSDVETNLPSKNERILLVDLVPLQVYYYKHIMLRNFSVLNKGVTQGQMSLLNIFVELKKASNHPFLFPNAQQHFMEQMPETASGDALRSIIASSGKMLLLDKLLSRLKTGGHRVLIFSQMVRMLDILTDYLALRDYKFQRLDGSVGAEQRKRAIEHFNAPDSIDFCFLLSTRAGGLGLNLTSADTVIIFDSDLNPQNDLQAMARAHRIGQTKQVNVYRFVSKDTIEESIIERAKRKMVLEYCIIKNMDTSGREVAGGKPLAKFSKDELNEILRFGAKNMFERDEAKIDDVDLDDILARAEEREQQEKKELASREFLDQFQVTEFGYNQLSWEDIIPEADRKALEEEKKRQEEIGKKQQEDAMIMRKYKKSIHKNVEEISSSPESRSRRSRRTLDSLDTSKRKTRSGIVYIDEQACPLNEKQIRMLSRSLCKFGDINTRTNEIIQDSQLGSVSLPDVIKVSNEILHVCLEAVEENLKTKSVSATYQGVQLNATHIVSRTNEMLTLANFFSRIKVVDHTFRLGISARPVANWTCSWSGKEDSLLLVGVYKYGFGSWDKIKDDPELGLQTKLFLEESERDKIPRPEHLVRRVESIIKLLAEGMKQESYKPAKRRSTRKQRESSDTEDVKRGSSRLARKQRKEAPQHVSPIRTTRRTTRNSLRLQELAFTKTESDEEKKRVSSPLSSISASPTQDSFYDPLLTDACVEIKKDFETSDISTACEAAMAKVQDSLSIMNSTFNDPSVKIDTIRKGLLEVGRHINQLLSNWSLETNNNDNQARRVLPNGEIVPSEADLWKYVALWFSKRPEWDVPRALYIRLEQREQERLGTLPK